MAAGVASGLPAATQHPPSGPTSPPETDGATGTGIPAAGVPAGQPRRGVSY